MFCRMFPGRVIYIKKAERNAEKILPQKSFLTESFNGAKKDMDCICTHKPLKDKRKEASISPSLLIGIDNKPPVTSSNPVKNKTAVLFPAKT